MKTICESVSQNLLPTSNDGGAKLTIFGQNQGILRLNSSQNQI